MVFNLFGLMKNAGRVLHGGMRLTGSILSVGIEKGSKNMKRIEDWQIKYVENRKKKRTFENGLLLKMEQDLSLIHI